MNTTSTATNLETLVWVTEQTNKYAVGLSKVARYCTDFADKTFNVIPKSVADKVKATKIISALGVILLVPHIYRGVKDIVKAENPSTTTAKVWRLGILLSYVFDSFADTVYGIQLLIGREIEKLSWTKKISAFTAPFYAVNIALSTQEFSRYKESYLSLSQKIQPINTKETQTRQIVDITKTLKAIQTNQDALCKVCKMSDKSILDQRIKAIMEKLKVDQEKGLLEAKTAIETLQRRMKVSYIFEASGLALAIGRYSMSIINLNLPKLPVLLFITAAIHVSSFSHMIFSQVVLNRDPFAKPQTWYEKVPYYVRETTISAMYKTGLTALAA